MNGVNIFVVITTDKAIFYYHIGLLLDSGWAGPGLAGMAWLACPGPGRPWAWPGWT